MDFIAFAAPSEPGLNQWAAQINAEAKIGGVPPCALAAIVARETGGRNVLQEGMPPGPGCGVGLCQVTSSVDWSDVAHPTFRGYDLLDPGQNLYVAAAWFLGPSISDALRLQRVDPVSFARFGGGQALWYAYAGYNEGWGAVMKRYDAGQNPDGGTTDGYGAWTFAKYLALVAEAHQQVGR